MRRTTLLLAFTLILSACLIGCGQKTSTDQSALEELAATEVKEYQGKDLSSIRDLHENAIAGTQYIDVDTYTLKVDGLVENPMEYTYEQVLEKPLYEKLVTLNCVEGWSVDILWEGVLLKDLFEDAKVKSEANTVIFHSYDEYTTSLPLQTILDKNIIIAYKMNGVILPPQRGFPFQLVAEDKLGYKWAKWITRIELSDDPDYRGYWEQRGYSNEADVSR
jgi:DMSO/TMAO reductase YedYZ molybdopterin-dependent catalytic subunit